ncbi:MAG: hypothetical protein IPK82_34795 [Polyangiaceae bacterium]|nr:hypothetical protein [Polyangiaceae bacterium]
MSIHPPMMLEPTNSSHNADGDADPRSIKLGDVTFSPTRVVLTRDGQVITSVRRDAIESV